MIFPFLFSSDKKLYQSLKNILGFYPQNILLYKQAFRHSSASNEIKPGLRDSNERLEFLGDAILGSVISDFLFQTFPYKDEGFLTKMRSKIVNRTSLNQLAMKLGINSFIEKSNHLSKDFSISGNAFEALIGAIYIDKGYDVAKKFIVLRLIKNHIDILQIENTESDFKSKLVEWAQKEKKELKFNVLEEIGNGNQKEYVIEVMIDGINFGRAQHYSKKRAEQMAAEKTMPDLHF